MRRLHKFNLGVFIVAIILTLISIRPPSPKSLIGSDIPERQETEIIDTLEIEPVQIIKHTTKSLYRSHIDSCGREYGLDTNLIYAVIFRESRWDSNAHNRKSDCRGLMQIKEGVFDPKTNISNGCSMLRYYINKFNSADSLLMGLTAYHRGYKGAKRYRKKHGKPSGYAYQVMGIFNKYEDKQKKD